MQTFMGHVVYQTWDDIGIWEKFFYTYPVKTLIEFGSGYGGMTLFFALQCYQRGIDFHTYDNQTVFDPTTGLHGLLGTKAKFHNVNIFGTEGFESQAIGALMDSCPRPLCIFFDDGDKPREWKVYAPHTQPGDFLAVHDWGTEFKEGDITVPVERIMVRECEGRPESDWKAMWFVRV